MPVVQVKSGHEKRDKSPGESAEGSDYDVEAVVFDKNAAEDAVYGLTDGTGAKCVFDGLDLSMSGPSTSAALADRCPPPKALPTCTGCRLRSFRPRPRLDLGSLASRAS